MRKRWCEKVGYIRVSTEDQNPENQKIQLIDAGIAEDCIFTDKGVSGTKPARERPAFKRLLEFTKKHQNEVKFLYVYELSRLGRTTLETLNIIDEIEKSGIQVWSLSPNEEFSRSEDKACRQLLMMLLSWVAERERANLVERTKAGLDRARAEGKTLGRRRADIDWDTVSKMRDDGKDWDEIAQSLGITNMTLYRHRKRRGLV